jgi:hypothetical protein
MLHGMMNAGYLSSWYPRLYANYHPRAFIIPCNMTNPVYPQDKALSTYLAASTVKRDSSNVSAHLPTAYNIYNKKTVYKLLL